MIPPSLINANPTAAFLESEVNQRLKPPAAPKPTETRKQTSTAAIPPRPRTPGEILPEILQTELRKQALSQDTHTRDTTPRISTADSLILEGEQLSYTETLLPNLTTPAAPETTTATEHSTPPGKQLPNKQNTVLH
jgi:hypothetical protein